MNPTKTTRRVALGAIAAAVAGFATQGSAAGHGIDLAGETVEFVIPFSESGGSAKWANFYAPLLSEALPGNPTVVVRFMPGAGSTKGANWFQEQEYENGTVIFGTSGSTQFPYLLGDPRVRYEYGDWNVVLASGTGGVAYLPPDLAGQMDGLDATPLQGENFIYGSQGATRLDLVPLLAWEMLGLSVEPVFGIKGRGDGRLMFERGEANIDYQTSSSYLTGVTPRPDLPGHSHLQRSVRGDAGMRDIGRAVGCVESVLRRGLPGAENGILAARRFERRDCNLHQGVQRHPRAGRFRRDFGKPTRPLPADDGPGSAGHAGAGHERA